MKSKTIALIPARGGSKRLENKNLLLFGDKPLLAHSILYAQANSDIIDAVYVSTNDPAIKECALQYGAQVIDRPDALSNDDEPTITALQHALTSLSTLAKNVVLLQPTNPLRPEHLLREAFEIYEYDKKDSLFTVTRNYHKLGKINADTFTPFNYTIGQRSQDLEPLYFENGLLYITKTTLLTAGTIISENAFPFIVDHPFASVDIDTKSDFDYATYLLNTINP